MLASVVALTLLALAPLVDAQAQQPVAKLVKPAAPTPDADALQDIGKLLKQGQHAQALEQVDKYLAGKPKDAQGRFLKGVILAEMNKPDEATAIFTKLTEDYPELPEPYNNLAVIYAQQKQFDRARQALEMAIRTNPSYTTAYENLGDIYARQASQAYDKALQLDPANSSAQNKFALMRDLMRIASRPGKATKPIGDARPADPVKIAGSPAPANVAAAPASDANTEITRAIELWAAAWSRKDVKAYLAAYAPDFKTPAGESRAAWDAEREKRINKPGALQVSVENLRISVDGDTATVKFRQHFKSAKNQTSSNKVLQLAKRDGKWLILQERVGS
ncbi:MAG: tetratricopeptide repeat protein [Betaproteobacteria bacterium]|nr:tetratricopeptide repeat protein [Betaproteobacteria bacterium]